MTKFWFGKNFLVAAALFGLDRIFKQLALKTLSGQESFLLIKNFGFQLFKNNKFFGMLPLNQKIFMAFLFFFFLLLVALLLKEALGSKRKEVFWLLVMLAGASSNLLDRIIYGRVIDFFVLGPWVLNFSDLLIAAGIINYIRLKKGNQ